MAGFSLAFLSSLVCCGSITPHPYDTFYYFENEAFSNKTVQFIVTILLVAIKISIVYC